MNVNNLQNLKSELRELGFSKELVADMEKQMQKNNPDFQLRAEADGTKRKLDFVLHFKQSSRTDYYFFNKFDVMLNKAKPLEEGQKYMVISPGEQNKPVFRKFSNPNEAIDYFKEQKGNNELAAGKDPASKTTLARMEEGKVAFVDKDFSKVFYTPAVRQTFYPDKGKGFTAQQAANLVEGRSVYRDDLLNIAGAPYKAWVALDFEKQKDRFQNYVTRQFHDPSYGFDLAKTLDKFNIKELSDPAARQKLEESLKNGNRPMVTVMKDGQETKMLIEAVPRYSQINFYQENGKSEKREQFLETPKATIVNQGKGMENKLTESHGRRM